MFEYVIENHWAFNLVKSLLFVILVVLLRVASSIAIDKKLDRNADARLRLKVQIRNLSFTLILFGLFFIWSTEIRTLALSLVAVAVGLILATKEIIMCVMGSLFKASAGSFTVGDRVVIGEFRGDVIDEKLLSTTLMEIGPGKEMHQQTGRAITLPNSMFVTTPVVNESYRQNYVLHAISIPIKRSPRWKEAETILYKVANKVCEPFLKEAEDQLVQAARRRLVDVPNINPRVSVSLQDTEKMTLLLRVPAPVRRRGRVEQEILRKFLEQFPDVD